MTQALSILLDRLSAADMVLTYGMAAHRAEQSANTMPKGLCSDPRDTARMAMHDRRRPLARRLERRLLPCG